MIWWHIVLTCVISYFVGNISFGRFVAASQHKDITKMGSGNPGTTNILRNMGMKFGIITLVLDIVKGVVPSVVAYFVFGRSYTMLYIAGLSAIVGHIFPVIFKFKGGKGMATMIGVFAVAAPVTTTIVGVIAILFWLAFKYGSLACFWIVTALTVTQGIRVKKTLPVADARLVCILLFCIFVLTWFAERGNIQRLMLGKENKVDLLRTTKKKMKL